MMFQIGDRLILIWLQFVPFDFEKDVRTSNHPSYVRPWAVLGRSRFGGDGVTQKDWDTQ